MSASKSKRSHQVPLPSPITRSKIERSNSITSLFIEEVSSCEGCRKTERIAIGRKGGIRVTWRPELLDSTIDSNESNDTANNRSPEPWMKWTCWILILVLGLCFMTLIVCIGMTQSSKIPVPTIIPEPRSGQINTELEPNPPEVVYSRLMDSPKTTREGEKSEVYCPDDPACRNSTTFFCYGHVGNTVDQCVNYTFVCDGVNNCDNGMDEKHCIILSNNITELEPIQASTTVEGYVLVRIRGVWHPYCSNEWTKLMGSRICDHLGHAKLDTLRLYSLEELKAKEPEAVGLDERIRLTVIGKSVSEGAESFQTFDVENVDESVPWRACRVAYLACSMALND